MAAAALARSRGMTAFSTTKDLFIMFSLLCLVCLSSSLRNKNQLLQEVLEENYEKAEQELDELKEDKSLLLKTVALADEYLAIMDPLIAGLKKIDALFGKTDLGTDMEGIKVSLLEDWIKMVIANEGLDEEIAHKENQLRKLTTLIEHLEEQQAEL